MNAITGKAAKILEKVRLHILEEPKRLVMEDWAIESDEAPCGTAACIAGWTVLLSRPKSKWKSLVRDAGRLEGDACAILSDAEINPYRLFYEENWPEPFRTRYDKARSARARAQAAARIRHLIKTGE